MKFNEVENSHALARLFGEGYPFLFLAASSATLQHALGEAWIEIVIER